MKLTTLSVLATLVAGAAFAADETVRNPLTDSETWQDLRYDIIGDTELSDGSAVFEVDAPYRAHDAATVPLVIRQTDPNVRIGKATIPIWVI